MKNGKIDLRTISLMREILGYHAAIADVAFSEPWLAILPIALFGPEALKSELLDGCFSGDLLPAFALCEPDAGSDAAAILTKAKKEGSEYRISGRKTWISNAGIADIYVVFEGTGEGPGARGISAFILDNGLAGISLEIQLDILSAHTLGTVSLEGVRVSTDRLLGQPGQGFHIAMTVLERLRPTVGAAALGFARRAMSQALERSIERVTFNKPICEHQLVQAKLADMAVKVDAAALMVYRSAWLHDVCNPRIAREAAMAKLYATEAAQQVVDQAMQIFGGLGVLKGTMVEWLYRHVRAYRIFDGASEIQQLIIFKEMLRAFRSANLKANQP